MTPPKPVGLGGVSIRVRGIEVTVPEDGRPQGVCRPVPLRCGGGGRGRIGGRESVAFVNFKSGYKCNWNGAKNHNVVSAS